MTSLTKYLLLGLIALGCVLGPLFGDGEGDGGRDGGIVVLPQAVALSKIYDPTPTLTGGDETPTLREPRMTRYFHPGQPIELQLPQDMGDAWMVISVGGQYYGSGRVSGHRLSISPVMVLLLAEAGVRDVTLHLIGPDRAGLELEFEINSECGVELRVY